MHTTNKLELTYTNFIGNAKVISPAFQSLTTVAGRGSAMSPRSVAWVVRAELVAANNMPDQTEFSRENSPRTT